jgi:NitT/TauT family transport system permease protein
MAVVILLWEVGVRAFSVPAYLLPPPSAVLAEVARQWRPLTVHATATMIEVLIGFSLSAVVGIAFGVAVVTSPLMERGVYPLLVSAQTIPKVAIAPLFVIWFGFGIMPKILIIFLIAVFPIVINTVLGLRMLSREMVYLILTMGGGHRELLRRVALPMALPAIFTGLKVAAALAVVGAIVGEFVGSDRGLGYLLTVANGNMDAKMVFAAVLVLSVLGLVFFIAVEALEALMVPWNRGRSATARMERL